MFAATAPTVITLLILLAAVGGVLYKMKGSGKGGCGCSSGCSGCGGSCASQQVPPAPKKEK